MYADAHRLIMTVFFIPVFILFGIGGYLLGGTVGASVLVGALLLFVLKAFYCPR